MTRVPLWVLVPVLAGHALYFTIWWDANEDVVGFGAVAVAMAIVIGLAIALDGLVARHSS